MDPYTQAALISGGASIIGGAFSGSSWGKDEKDSIKDQYRYQIRYQPKVNSAIMRGRMADAAEHSIHPLVMAGIDPGSGGGFSGMPGQSNIGQGIARAGENVANAKLARERVRAEIDLLKAQANNLGQKPPQTPSPITGQNIPVGVTPPIDPKTQEVKKAEVVPRQSAVPHAGLGDRPLTNQFTIGRQKIHFMAEEPSDLAEDPGFNLAMAFFDRSNNAVDWRKAIRDFAGMKHPTDYKKRNQAERIIEKRFLWGLVKFKRHYKIPRYMGR